jgi:hypothetical protein
MNTYVQNIVKANATAHATRQAHFIARRETNLATYGTEFPFVGAETQATFAAYVWTPQAPIIPVRISQRHPMCH